MALNFLKFPFLVQKQISQHFDDSDLFLLSILSKNSAGAVRRIGLEAKKLRFYFRQGDVLEIKSIGGEEDEIRERFASFQCVSSDSMAQKWWRTVKLRIGDVKLRCIKYINAYSGDYHELQYAVTCQTTLIKALQTHIASIFRRPPHIQLYMFTCLENPKIENVKELILIDHEDKNPENLKKHLMDYPNLDGARITHWLKFSPDSRIFSIKKLICEASHVGAEAILRNFKGTCLWMKWARIQKETLSEFIENWRRGDEKYDNLKAVDVSDFFIVSFFRDTVRQDFMEGIKGASRWKPERRPQNYSLDEKLLDTCIFPHRFSIFHKKSIDCADYYDVIQTKTGKLASFRVTSNQFTFLVWDISLEIESIVDGMRLLNI